MTSREGQQRLAQAEPAHGGSIAEATCHNDTPGGACSSPSTLYRMGGSAMPTQTHSTPQPPVQATVLKVKTHVKAGSIIVHD